MPWYTDAIRLEVFVVLLSGVVDRPLPPVALCESEDDATRDLNKASPAQLSRPHPRWQYLWNLLTQGGAAVAVGRWHWAFRLAGQSCRTQSITSRRRTSFFILRYKRPPRAWATCALVASASLKATWSTASLEKPCCG